MFVESVYREQGNLSKGYSHYRSYDVVDFRAMRKVEDNVRRSVQEWRRRQEKNAQECPRIKTRRGVQVRGARKASVYHALAVVVDAADDILDVALLELKTELVADSDDATELVVEVVLVALYTIGFAARLNVLPMVC